MRHNTITCDWCGSSITEQVFIRTSEMLIPHFTTGGRAARDFCSETCAQANADHNSINRIPCEFSWDASDGREDHRHICKHGSLYNGRAGGNHLECWCECGSHTERPPDWLEQRLRQHLADGIDARVANALRGQLARTASENFWSDPPIEPTGDSVGGTWSA